MTSTIPQLRIVGDYWRTNWRDSGGKQRWKSFGNVKKVSRSEAVERYTEFLRQFMDDTALREGSRKTRATVDQLADAYMIWAEAYYIKPNGKLSGEVSNLRYALKTARTLFGKKRVADFMPADLRACQDAMIESGICRKSINARINRIRRVFAWGVEEGVVSAGVWHGLMAVKHLRRGRTAAIDNEPVHPAPEADIKAAMEFMPRTIKAMVELQLASGMRPGEARLMRLVDIDMGVNPWAYTPTEHKTQHLGRDRTILLGPKAQAVLRPFLSRRTTAWVFSPRDDLAEGYEDRRQPEKRKTDRTIGQQWTVMSYGRAVGRACRKAGVPPWTPNQLRHTAATRIRKEFGAEAARVILGHARLSTTEIYAEQDFARAREIIAEVG